MGFRGYPVGQTDAQTHRHTDRQTHRQTHSSQYLATALADEVKMKALRNESTCVRYVPHSCCVTLIPRLIRIHLVHARK